MQKVEAMVALSCLLAACSSEHSGSIIDRDAGMAVDAGTLIDSGAEPPEPQRAFTHKMMKRTGENMFAMLVKCEDATRRPDLVAPVWKFKMTLWERTPFLGLPTEFDARDETCLDFETNTLHRILDTNLHSIMV